MSYGKVFRNAAAICLMIAGNAASQSLLPAGDVEIVVPAGWSVTKQPAGGVLLHRTDNGNPSVINISSESFSGPVAGELRRSMQAGFANVGLRLDRLTEGISTKGFP